MTKHYFAQTLLLVFTIAFVLAGCSQDQSTAPDTSSLTSQKLSGIIEYKDVLITHYGDRPRAALEAAGAIVREEYKYIPVMEASVPAYALDALRKNPKIRAIEEDVVHEYCQQTLDWGVDRIDAEYVHAESGNRGAGINVAVLDTGGDKDHPDLTWSPGTTVMGKDTTRWDDKNGHGTHCAGIISADDNDIGIVGVAPECDVIMVQISRASRISLFKIIKGIEWCIATHHDGDEDNDVQIMSMSFSGGPTEAEGVALSAAYAEGILLVAAAGNSRSDVANYYPAAHPDVMAISGIDAYGQAYYNTNYGEEIELIAPAVNVLSTYLEGSYTTMTGTSMACPHVAGTAALIWSDNPSMTHQQVRDQLHATAEDISFPQTYQGYGLVDAENATLGTTFGDD
ncbi:MAG: S8 family peptidase [Candidatus Zixiibacteriota bacterium]|nr:MAG: S8 family peptidase [candidate division Zixibacteria bacterium]